MLFKIYIDWNLQIRAVSDFNSYLINLKENVDGTGSPRVPAAERYQLGEYYFLSILFVVDHEGLVSYKTRVLILLLAHFIGV